MRIFLFVLTAISALFTAGLAQASDTKFFQKIQGKWSGPGEIVAGKYKGTKFVCTFDGAKPGRKIGMDIDGSCRVGVFSQPMNAEIIKSAAGYIGKFLDGEQGDGMDVNGGRYTRDRLVVDIKRNNLDSIMVASLKNRNTLNVTISVKHQGKLIPVIGMNLARKSDPIVTGSVN
ncbi:MAG: hypothetical protein AAF478_12415 [Pseudomonadota bacterium]